MALGDGAGDVSARLMLRRILVTSCLATLLAGASSPAPAVAAPACGGAVHGLRTVSLPKAGFQIGVPSSWQKMTSDTYARWLGREGSKDPNVAAFAAMLKDPRSPLKLFALACDGGAYPSTLSVMAFDLERTRGWNFDEFEQGALVALRKHAVRGHSPKVEKFRIRIGRAVRIRALQRPTGAPASLLRTTYLILSRRNAYMVSYGTVPALAARYAHIFDDSVRSLREL